ncbi:MAG TPA: RluA family pseudouridine synthase [Candidatus Kapabacteria bacterium]|nr:RluA family pseudouridine synthase [Candidatus Kapabacteria bacterium]
MKRSVAPIGSMPAPPKLADYRIFTVTVAAGERPERLDQYLARVIANTSRSKVREAIDSCAVFVNNRIEPKPAYQIKGGDIIEVFIPKPELGPVSAENIPLDIVFEDDDIIIINKPPSMVVHPTPMTRSGTLLNALMYHIEGIADHLDDPDRAGIVHRLDKDTSGLLVVAKNEYSHRKLARQFFDHTAHRIYNAVCWGVPKNRFGRLVTQIDRHPKDRKKFAVAKEGGKTAISEYIVLEELAGFSLVELRLETGRTHQIRVHMQHLGHPVFGDPHYGGRTMRVINKDVPHFRQWVENLLASFPRQALHARLLRLYHPRTEELMEWQTELPEDMMYVLGEIRRMTNLVY